jgi:hypothetical protein
MVNHTCIGMRPQSGRSRLHSIERSLIEAQMVNGESHICTHVMRLGCSLLGMLSSEPKPYLLVT